MKYSEFEREVEKLGFTHSTRCAEIVVKVHGRTVMGVSTNLEYIVDSEWDEFQSLHKKTQGELFDLAYQLAKTPIVEREEEKKYYLRLATKIDVYEDRRYLNMDIPNEKYTLSENKDDAYYKAIFTETEISQMDITGFQKVEVTE